MSKASVVEKELELELENSVENEIEFDEVKEDDEGVEAVDTGDGIVRVVHTKSKSPKDRATALVEKDVMERIRNLVWWERTTVQDFVESAIVEKLEAAEAANKGAYKAREGNLKTGRRSN